MALDSDDIKKIAGIMALVQQGVAEVASIIQNKQAQAGKTEQEILAHAEEANKKARELIDAL